MGIELIEQSVPEVVWGSRLSKSLTWGFLCMKERNIKMILNDDDMSWIDMSTWSNLRPNPELQGARTVCVTEGMMACPSRKSFDEIFSKVIPGQHVHCAPIQMDSLGAQMTETLSLSMLSSKITTNDQSQIQPHTKSHQNENTLFNCSRKLLDLNIDSSQQNKNTLRPPPSLVPDPDGASRWVRETRPAAFLEFRRTPILEDVYIYIY